LEYNSVRPYTYSHRYVSENDEVVIGAYSHYNQELAHPLGANFREILTVWNYRINENWQIRSKIMWAVTGLDKDANVGNDILEPNDTRVSEYGNKIAQGIKTNIVQYGFSLSYMPFHNHYFDFKFLYRNRFSANAANDIKSLYFGLSFRANMSRQKLDY